MLRIRRYATGLAFVFLVIEFLDELLFGIAEAAWPLIRDDFSLDYIQIGLLMTLPGIASLIVEPVLGILGDVWHRRRLILGGGIAYALAALLASLSDSFGPLLFAFMFIFPASGAFVSLGQASLMDLQPKRREQNMARWDLAGSLGVLVGPLLLLAAVEFGAGWRVLFGLWAALALVAVLFFGLRSKAMVKPPQEARLSDFWTGLKEGLAALRQPGVLRWLILLPLSDLMLDSLFSYIALYFVDVAGTDDTAAVSAVAVWSIVGLLGSVLIIPLLERVPGLRYMRWSILADLLLYPAFLLLPAVELKLLCLAGISLSNAGWYAVLQAQLYMAMPDKSATVLTLENLISLPAILLPLVLGFIASQFGLEWAMWLLLIAPLGLWIGLPRKASSEAG
jgi:FSR family fosmidomycin resistance protein-like MFS transporter